MGILSWNRGTEPKFPIITMGSNGTQMLPIPLVLVEQTGTSCFIAYSIIMRRCILNDAGNVVYYLHANDSTKRDNGAAADLTGATGQVMVEIPEHYVRFEMEGTKRRCLMSIYALPGFRRIPKMYISAYEAALQRSTLKLASVVNTSADYRGGNQTGRTKQNTIWDVPTAISLTN